MALSLQSVGPQHASAPRLGLLLRDPHPPTSPGKLSAEANPPTNSGQAPRPLDKLGVGEAPEPARSPAKGFHAAEQPSCNHGGRRGSKRENRGLGNGRDVIRTNHTQGQPNGTASGLAVLTSTDLEEGCGEQGAACKEPQTAGSPDWG